MSKTKAIRIIEEDPDGFCEAELSQKNKGDDRIYTLTSRKGYVKNNQELMNVKIVGDMEKVVINSQHGQTEIDMRDFFDLQMIMRHIDDIPGSNMFGDTFVAKKKKKKS